MILVVLHEFSLNNLHKPTEFFPPYTIRNDAGYEPSHIRDTCEKHASGLLQCVLSYDDNSLREVPVIVFIRMMHAVVILAKLHILGQSLHAFEITTNLYRKLEVIGQNGRFLLPQMFVLCCADYLNGIAPLGCPIASLSKSS
jgi:hypothetical protein